MISSDSKGFIVLAMLVPIVVAPSIGASMGSSACGLYLNLIGAGVGAVCYGGAFIGASIICYLFINPVMWMLKQIQGVINPLIETLNTAVDKASDWTWDWINNVWGGQDVEGGIPAWNPDWLQYYEPIGDFLDVGVHNGQHFSGRYGHFWKYFSGTAGVEYHGWYEAFFDWGDMFTYGNGFYVVD